MGCWWVSGAAASGPYRAFPVLKWRNDPDAVRPWFTQVHRGLASAVSSAVGIPITVQPWNELAWLTDPSVVAEALNHEFEETRPEDVEGGTLST